MTPRRVIGLLHREIRGLHEAAYLLAFFTFTSQFFALIRDRLLAHQFGASETLDIFYAAFRIPDTMYTILASTVSIFVLIPFLESTKLQGTDVLRRFLSTIFSFFSGVLIAFASCTYVIAPDLVNVLYGSFSATAQAELVSMVRILLLQPLLLGVSNLFAAYVQMRGRFLLYAVAPILYNVGIIIGIIFFYPIMGIVGLAWGVVLGAFLHGGVQFPYILKSNMVPFVRMPDWKIVGNVVRVSVPRTITLSSQQIVMLVMISIASSFAVGSVAAFNFAWNLQSVPLAIIGISYSVAAFPQLSRLYIAKEYKEYVHLVVFATRQIIFWAMPTVVFVIVLRAQIVRIILGSGAFDWGATKMTAAILAILTLSLVAQGVTVLLVRASYAAGKTLIPLIAALLSSVITITIAYVLLYATQQGNINLATFARMMRVQDVPGVEILFISCAYLIGSFVHVLFFLIYFEKTYHGFLKKITATTIQALFGSAVAGYGAYLALHLLAPHISQDTFVGIFEQGVLAGVIGACLWSATLVFCNNQDIVTVWMTFQKKLSTFAIKKIRGQIDVEI